MAHQPSLLAALFVSMKWVELINSFSVQTFPRHLRSHLQPPGRQKVPWALVPMLPIVQAGSEEFAASRYVQLQEYYWTVLLLKGAVTKLLWQPIWRLEDISLPVPLSGPRIEKKWPLLFISCSRFFHSPASGANPSDSPSHSRHLRGWSTLIFRWIASHQCSGMWRKHFMALQNV